MSGQDLAGSHWDLFIASVFLVLLNQILLPAHLAYAHTGQSESAFPKRNAVFQPMILKDLIQSMKMHGAVCITIK